jgi:hypothetical protein
VLHYFDPIRSTNDATDERSRFLLDTAVEKEVSPEELGRLALRESLYYSPAGPEWTAAVGRCCNAATAGLPQDFCAYVVRQLSVFRRGRSRIRNIAQFSMRAASSIRVSPVRPWQIVTRRIAEAPSTTLGNPVVARHKKSPG